MPSTKVGGFCFSLLRLCLATLSIACAVLNCVFAVVIWAGCCSNLDLEGQGLLGVPCGYKSGELIELFQSYAPSWVQSAIEDGGIL